MDNSQEPMFERPGTRAERHRVPLPQSFYEPSASVVGERLLGHYLLRRTPEGMCGGPIVEAEAYLVNDPACHGFRGETPRNRSMYGPPGHAYVYFIYGNHYCVNAVCCPRGTAEAVLVRAIEPLYGLEILQRNRPRVQPNQWTNGPGKLCAALGIDRAEDGRPLWEAGSSVWIAANPDVEKFRCERGPLRVGSRIGITAAADLPLRFWLAGSGWVSRR
jgi:DNA-3-methyladenine glycosylase